MSYILDALRRLEQDKEMAKRGANPMEAVLVPDIEGVEEPERRRLWWVGAVAVLLLTVVALTYWITRHSLAPPTEHARKGTVPQSSSEGPGFDRSAPVSSPEAISSAVQPLPENREGAAPSPSLSKPAEVAEPSPPIRAEEESRPVVSTAPEALSAREEETALPLGASKAEGIEVIEEWRGSEIKINAIAYSRDPGSRFAVVNLKTVHEGDRIEGLAVVEIQENGIVFEEGGTKYGVFLGKH
jgi:hypothetical protein